MSCLENENKTVVVKGALEETFCCFWTSPLGGFVSPLELILDAVLWILSMGKTVFGVGRFGCYFLFLVIYGIMVWGIWLYYGSYLMALALVTYLIRGSLT